MKKLISLFFILVSICAASQQNRVQASVDTLKNKIGAEFKLTLKTNVDTMSTVVFPAGKSFGPLEVINSYPIDTIKQGSSYELIKRYGLTQFDSGKYTIPKLKVLINKKPFLTQDFSIEVTNVSVDTTKQKMYDIKDIIKVGKNPFNWWPYILIAIAISAVGFLVYWLIKKRQTKKRPPEIFKTPIEKATSLLNQLEQKKLWQKGEVKAYYSELTDIARNYIEEAIKIPAMESTTSELILALRNASVKKNMQLTPETVENLERVLRQADLVKFAKSKPLEFEIADDRSKIERAIIILNKSLPEEVTEVQLSNEEFKRRKLKKQKINRIIITVGAVVFLFIATAIYFVATKGFDYLKDNIIGHPTKELAEGEWVTSEYGNPGISLETPKVLKRMDAKNALPKETLAFVKDFQVFAYGAMTDNFHIAASTMTYKEGVQMDLDKALEGVIISLETKGAKNMTVKKEGFESKEGVSAVKGFGTLTMLDPVKNENIKMKYEIVLFGQQASLQQIILMHREDDKYAIDISKRIFNSAVLKKLDE